MNNKELSQKIEEIIRLDTRPVAVKLYKNREDLPKKPQNIKQNFCQLVSIARYQGRSNSSAADKMICSMGAACIGLIPTPEAISSGKAAIGAYCKDEEAAKKFMANTFKLGDAGKQADGVMVTPLAEVTEEPDVVVFYCNPAQVIRFIHAYAHDTGEKVTADTVAEAAMCSCVGYAVANKKPVIGLPCAGDRIFGGTQNHELVFVAPYAWVRDKLVNNLEATAAGGFSVYPIPPNMHWTPAMPPTYTVQPEDLEK
jgi:uncharacterized protein (DUF169 family)